MADPRPDRRPHLGPDLGRRALLRTAAVAPVAALLAACDASAPGSSGTPSPSVSPSAGGSAGTTTAPSSPTATGSAGTAAAGDGLARTLGGERVLTTGIEVPWSIVFLPGGDVLVSSRDTGQVLRVTPRGRRRVVGVVPDVVSSKAQGGEAGLLGLALHPRFAAEPWVYAYHTTSGDNRVVRMRYGAGGLGRPQLVLDGIRTSLHHNGGGLVFGPDGHLFVSTGDAEQSADAQDRQSLNGKILRVTDTGRTPAGNPFRNPVWTYGHRNVEGLAFDDQGQLWASEFGNQLKDELNRIDRGGNYGWPLVEGVADRTGLRDPIATWLPDDCSPSGIAVVNGRAWLGALQGQCVFSVVLRGSDRGLVQRHLATGRGRIRAVAAAPDGSLWVGTSNRDGRLTPKAGDDHLLRVPFA